MFTKFFYNYNVYFSYYQPFRYWLFQSRIKNIAEFPDAVTERGLKHLNELIEAKNRGFDIYLAFIIQREDCKKFKIAEDIDPKYKKLLTIVVDASIYLEEYARSMIAEEEQHSLELKAMLKDYG